MQNFKDKIDALRVKLKEYPLSLTYNDVLNIHSILFDLRIMLLTTSLSYSNTKEIYTNSELCKVTVTVKYSLYDVDGEDIFEPIDSVEATAVGSVDNILDEAVIKSEISFWERMVILSHAEK